MSGQNFNKLTIDGVTYTAVDPTKLAKPTNTGAEGQVLTKTAAGSEWKTITVSGGSSYTAGAGIIIADDVIQANIDNNTIVIKADKLSVDTSLFVSNTVYTEKMQELDSTLGNISDVLDYVNTELVAINHR